MATGWHSSTRRPKPLKSLHMAGLSAHKSGLWEKRWLCTLFRIYRGDSTFAITGINRDTNRITYRCFLPDLTRFATVCCAAADRQCWITQA
jgi:hypothetical protein